MGGAGFGEAMKIEAIDVSSWVSELLVLTDELVAKVAERAQRENAPAIQATFELVAAVVVSRRLDGGPLAEAKAQALPLMGAMMDQLVADIDEALAERAAKAQ